MNRATFEAILLAPKRRATTSSLTPVGVTTAANATLDSIYSSPSYIAHNGSSSNPAQLIATKLAGTEIVGFTLYGGATDNNTYGGSPTLSWTGATGGNGTIPAGNDSGTWRSINGVTGVDSGLTATVTIGAAAKKLRLYMSSFDVGGGAGTVTLNDGSALTSTQSFAGVFASSVWKYLEWTLNANAAGQTATIKLTAQNQAATGWQIAYGAIVLGD